MKSIESDFEYDFEPFKDDFFDFELSIFANQTSFEIEFTST